MWHAIGRTQKCHAAHQYQKHAIEQTREGQRQWSCYVHDICLPHLSQSAHSILQKKHAADKANLSKALGQNHKNMDTPSRHWDRRQATTCSGQKHQQQFLARLQVSPQQISTHPRASRLTSQGLRCITLCHCIQERRTQDCKEILRHEIVSYNRRMDITPNLNTMWHMKSSLHIVATASRETKRPILDFNRNSKLAMCYNSSAQHTVRITKMRLHKWASSK